LSEEIALEVAEPVVDSEAVGAVEAVEVEVEVVEAVMDFEPVALVEKVLVVLLS
jgi:hypothetical protein